jgi:hypothetical protein
LSKELEKILDIIQFKTKMSLEEIADKIGYSRPYLNNAKKSGGSKKLIGVIMETFPEILQNSTNSVGKGKREEKGKEVANTPNIDLLATEDFKKFRGLVFARVSAIEANLRALNNKVAEINKVVTGETTTKTLTELEQTTREVQKMLLEELHRMFP